MVKSPLLSDIASSICATYHFELCSFVAGGTFKETYQVNNNGTQEALKIFFGGQSMARPAREIAAMRKCSHPNIARLIDVSSIVHNGTEYLFIREEYLAGGTLTDLLSEGQMPDARLFAVGYDLISALQHLSSHSLVHRDIKPDNVLFREAGEDAVLADLGLIRDLNAPSLTQTWILCGPGTPYYAAPEQLNNEKILIDWRSDQFALGVSLSICAYGKHPYERPNDSHADIVERVAQRASPSPDFLNFIQNSKWKTLPNMIAPWPHKRYRHPDDLLLEWARNKET